MDVGFEPGGFELGNGMDYSMSPLGVGELERLAIQGSNGGINFWGNRIEINDFDFGLGEGESEKEGKSGNDYDE